MSLAVCCGLLSVLGAQRPRGFFCSQDLNLPIQLNQFKPLSSLYYFLFFLQQPFGLRFRFLMSWSTYGVHKIMSGVRRQQQ